jgi:hypothetical protein
VICPGGLRGGSTPSKREMVDSRNTSRTTNICAIVSPSEQPIPVAITALCKLANWLLKRRGQKDQGVDQWQLNLEEESPPALTSPPSTPATRTVLAKSTEQRCTQPHISHSQSNHKATDLIASQGQGGQS